MDDAKYDNKQGSETINVNKRFQVNFKNPSDAKVVEDFVDDVQEAFSVETKYDALLLAIQMAKLEFARRDESVGRIGYAEKHYLMLQTQTENLLHSLKCALINADQGIQAVQQKCRQQIEQIEQEMADKRLEARTKIEELQIDKANLEKTNEALVQNLGILEKENHAFSSLKTAFDQNQSAWGAERTVLTERITELENVRRENVDLRDGIASLNGQIDELKKNLEANQHAYELKLKQAEIEFQKTLAHGISTEISVAEKKILKSLEPLLDGLKLQLSETQTQLKNEQEIVKAMASNRPTKTSKKSKSGKTVSKKR
jgi:chromosome segregation ATPase